MILRQKLVEIALDWEESKGIAPSFNQKGFYHCSKPPAKVKLLFISKDLL